MKKIRQWLKEGLSKEDYKRAENYRNEKWEWEESSFEDALDRAFSWQQAQEGWEYWNEIHENGGSLQDDPIVEAVDNNGWIKIENESDLPKKEIDVHFVFTDKTGKYQTFGVWDNKLKSFYSGALKIDNVIYYQPLIKPLPPKF